MYVHANNGKDVMPFIRAIAAGDGFPLPEPLAPLSRDEAFAKLHGSPVRDLKAAARRQKLISAAIVIRNSKQGE